MEKEEIIVDNMQEFNMRVTTRQYDISKGDKDFIVEEIIERDEDGNENNTLKVVKGETEKENEEILAWIEDNYDKVNLWLLKELIKFGGKEDG